LLEVAKQYFTFIAATSETAASLAQQQVQQAPQQFVPPAQSAPLGVVAPVVGAFPSPLPSVIATPVAPPVTSVPAPTANGDDPVAKKAFEDQVLTMLVVIDPVTGQVDPIKAKANYAKLESTLKMFNVPETKLPNLDPQLRQTFLAALSQ
jgi:hypothetical protein